MKKGAWGNALKKRDGRIQVGKSGFQLEQNDGKSDVRSQAGKSDINQVDQKKTDLSRAIGRSMWRLRRCGRKEHWYGRAYTMTEVGDAIGVSRLTISEIEAGTRKLTAAELVLAAKFFKVAITDLLPDEAPR
jgi:DNA-binding XRE family transcriptional regulator